MRHVLKYFILCNVLMVFAASAYAGSHQQSHREVSVSNVYFNLPAPDNSPCKSHKPEGQLLLEGKGLPILPRLDVSVKGILTSEKLTLHLQFTLVVADSPVTEFTQGVYHRYRPRDPTRS